MAQELSFRDVQVASSEIEIRKIGVTDLWQALKEGYDDFNATPSYVPFLIVIYPTFAVLLSLFLVGGDLFYLAFPLVAGFTLLGPAISIGLFELSRRREEGLDLKWRSAFEFIHSPTFAPIAALSLLMMILYVAWLYLAQMLYIGTFGMEPPASLATFWNELTTTRHGAALIMYGVGVGFLFAFASLALSVFAFPLLLDKTASTITAISVSLRGVTGNIWVMAIWGLVVTVLLTAGAFFFLIGLAAVLPILGHATWRLYRKVVG